MCWTGVNLALSAVQVKQEAPSSPSSECSSEGYVSVSGLNALVVPHCCVTMQWNLSFKPALTLQQK